MKRSARDNHGSFFGLLDTSFKMTRCGTSDSCHTLSRTSSGKRGNEAHVSDLSKHGYVANDSLFGSLAYLNVLSLE
jgi:hypothetical protein